MDIMDKCSPIQSLALIEEVRKTTSSSTHHWGTYLLGSSWIYTKDQTLKRTVTVQGKSDRCGGQEEEEWQDTEPNIQSPVSRRYN